MRRRRRESIFKRLNWESDYVPERRGLTEEPKGDRQPRWIGRGLVLAAVLLLLLAGASVYLKFRPRPFDAVRWQESGGFDRGRMLSSLLSQADFIGYTRLEAEHYLGRPDFDERQFWYDLGPADTDLPREPRADVGDPTRLAAVFSYNPTGIVTDVFYSYRRPAFGSKPFDSAGWFGDDRSARQEMIPHALRRLRTMGLNRAMVRLFLGPPDGHRVRAHYDVGFGGAVIGTGKALVLTYDADDNVIASAVVD
ncbi:MAG TPA: hypothetical protein VM118_05510 [Acidobacteriota bacterium]|nr:hypothetical protein [Acidobacteriota bacterium]